MATSKTKPTVDGVSLYLGIQSRLLRRVPVPEWGRRINVRDEYLRQSAYNEPTLAGIVNSVIQRDQSRAWTLTGTERQVNFFADVLLNADNDSWMNFVGRLAEAFYSTDYGGIIELGRERADRNRRITALWSVDPTRVTKNRDGTLVYRPFEGSDVNLVDFEWTDFYALPSSDARTYGLGRCAVGRVIEIVRIMQGILAHDNAELHAEQPDSILTVEGMTMDAFESAIERRKTRIENGELSSTAPLVLAGLETIKVTLASLARIPEDFSRQAFNDLMLQILAANFGFKAAEFFSLRTDAFISTETDAQTLRSTSKGDRAFSLALGERLTQVLPDTVSFNFDTKSDFARDLDAASLLDQARAIKLLSEAGIKSGNPIITRNEARAILKELKVLPSDVTILNEQFQVSRDQLMADVKVRALADLMNQRNRAEPLVRYTWKANEPDEHTILRQDIRELLHRKSFPVAKRATLIPSDNEQITVTDEDVSLVVADLPDDLKDLLADAL